MFDFNICRVRGGSFVAALGLALALFGSAPGFALDETAVPDLSGEQLARYQKLTNELRCLVCQNETIADSTAPLAGDLRTQVRSQILAGRSDREILKYVTARYGDFVLYRPPFKPVTWLLWIGPFVLLLLALLAAWRMSRRRVSAPSVPEPDAERLRRLLDEEQS